MEKGTTERLDQVSDMSRPGIEPGPPRWEASTLEKNHSNSFLIAIRNIYICAHDSTIDRALALGQAELEKARGRDTSRF